MCAAQKGLGGVRRAQARAPRPHHGRHGANGPRRTRRAACAENCSASSSRSMPPTWRWRLLVDGSRTREELPLQGRCRDVVVHRHGDAGYGSIRLPGEGGEGARCLATTIVPCFVTPARSSADRAPASGAGGAGSSPAGGALPSSSSSGFGHRRRRRSWGRCLADRKPSKRAISHRRSPSAHR